MSADRVTGTLGYTGPALIKIHFIRVLRPTRHFNLFQVRNNHSRHTIFRACIGVRFNGQSEYYNPGDSKRARAISAVPTGSKYRSLLISASFRRKVSLGRRNGAMKYLSSNGCERAIEKEMANGKREERKEREEGEVKENWRKEKKLWESNGIKQVAEAGFTSSL